MFTTFEKLLEHLRTPKEDQDKPRVNVSAKDTTWAIVTKNTITGIGLLFCWDYNAGKNRIGDWEYLSFTKEQFQAFLDAFVPAYRHMQISYRDMFSNV